MKRLAFTTLLGAAVAVSGCAAQNPFKRRADLVVERGPCEDAAFPIYFDKGADHLSPAAQQLVTDTASALKGCEVQAIRVVGLADADGPVELNRALSEARAKRVVDAFTAQGWPAPAFEVSAAGEAGAIKAGGRQEPLRRRTEVFVDVAEPR
ncbi:MAG TPA: OmpA family protein [Caulobacteraceae bacterium]|nr:OmpA family protein [Caulobacteraceae bacterium]